MLVIFFPNELLALYFLFMPSKGQVLPTKRLREKVVLALNFAVRERGTPPVSEVAALSRVPLLRKKGLKFPHL